MEQNKNQSQIIFYQTNDGQTKFQVKIDEETVWLTQEQIAELFEKSKSTINEHIKNIYAEKELEETKTMRKFGNSEFSTKPTNSYNLDIIISIGYRVKSQRGTQFRIWATQRLKEYIIKGFTIDDERLKADGYKTRYFDELLQRIRDIRSSERNFYQKITDIYATSVDYSKNTQRTQEFFATVQNKIHYAVHGYTAAEIIAKRADKNKPLMGLTNFKGNYITSQDIKIAKNYLSENELKQLNLIVSMYLDFAELQANNNRLMKMIDWTKKLDEFLKLSEHKLLHNAGNISTQQAAQKAEEELIKYRKNKNYISDFDRAVKEIEQKLPKYNKNDKNKTV